MCNLLKEKGCMRGRLIVASTIVFTLLSSGCGRSQHSSAIEQPSDSGEPEASKALPQNDRTTNRLIHEKSPYLLQHAHNPVDWYAWGKEAFEKARRENKPIFLSIGYSTCHWCHVMEHESFEDEEVAKLMNEVFVSIKVDREERPDIDKIYMSVCHMLTSGGGWPLTIIMTPDKKPFFAGTYFPKKGRFGRLGMMDLIPQIRDAWADKHEDILKSASQITAALQRSTPTTSGDELGLSTLKTAYSQLAGSFDKHRGGFGGGMKFPTPHNLLFLLRYWKRTGDANALSMAEETLQAMRRGGIYDHVGFGIHRYATDSKWLVPHFEKMLYDQALLAMAYTEAYQATQKAGYERTAREIFSYILRDMTSPEGGFYSAEDADSDGEEGKFYVWTEEELRQLLKPKEADLAIKVFNVERNGNFAEQATRRKTGGNILHLQEPLRTIASRLKTTEADLRSQLEAIRQKLFEVRERRIHPYKDDKILTDWNGLMIAALAKAAQAFDEPKYAEAAGRAADFILKDMRKSDGRLLHRYRNGDAAIQAHVDDYAFLVWGLIELYETTFDVERLDTALDLNEDLIEHFWDAKNGGFYFAADDGEVLLARQKVIYDGAVPSGNSVSMLNLLRLSRMTANADLEEKSAQVGRAFSKNVSGGPSSHTLLMTAVDFGVGPSYEVVIVGNSKAADTHGMLGALRKQFVPNKVVLLRPTEQNAPAITRLAAFTKSQRSLGDKATAYVCLNYNCKLPTTDIDKMLTLLDEGRQRP